MTCPNTVHGHRQVAGAWEGAVTRHHRHKVFFVRMSWRGRQKKEKSDCGRGLSTAAWTPYPPQIKARLSNCACYYAHPNVLPESRRLCRGNRCLQHACDYRRLAGLKACPGRHCHASCSRHDGQEVCWHGVGDNAMGQPWAEACPHPIPQNAPMLGKGCPFYSPKFPPKHPVLDLGFPLLHSPKSRVFLGFPIKRAVWWKCSEEK